MQGIDVSHYQGPIDWQQVANHGIQWAATKATQGTSYVDPTLSDNAYGMAGQESIKYRLYYHFLTPADPIAQAHWFISHIAPLPLAGLMADVEGQPVDDDAVATFCDEVERLTGRPMAIYVGVFYNGGTIWKSTKVWKQGRARILPAYTTEERAHAISLPYGWDVWQYTSSGSVPGIAGRVDMDQVDNPSIFNKICGKESAMYLYKDSRYSNVFAYPAGIDVSGELGQAMINAGTTVTEGTNDAALEALCHVNWGVTAGWAERLGFLVK